VKYWVLIGLVVIAFLLQQSVAPSYLAIGGITPNFLLVMVVTYGLLFGWEIGIAAAVLAGLLMDLTAGRFVGLHVLSLGFVGLLAGLVEEKVFKDNLLLAPLGGFVGSVISQTVVIVCLWFYGWQVNVVGSLRSTILPGALYDMVLAFFIYGRIFKYYLYLRPNPRGTINLRRY
jgi:rod shape-determining protein MreD